MPIITFIVRSTSFIHYFENISITNENNCKIFD